MMHEIRVRLSVTAGQARALLSLALLAALPIELGSESLTLVTTYPAPAGIYDRMITTGSTYLARDGGSVGIATTAPGAKLDVNGNIAIRDGTQADGRVLTSDANGVARWGTPGGAITDCIALDQSGDRPWTAGCPGGYTKVAWDTWGRDEEFTGGHWHGRHGHSILFCCR